MGREINSRAERGNSPDSASGEPRRPVNATEMPTRFAPVQGGQSEHSVGEQIGGRYEIVRRVGGGGMGMVYEAHDRELNRTVAIKRIRPELLAKSDVRQRFDQEAQAIATLNHPNIVQIFDRGSDAAGPYLVMEFVGGQSLEERLAAGKGLELDEVVQVVSVMCDALQAAHERGILHRDVKPANILFTSAGVPKLTDFGLARLETHSSVTQAGAIFGTPYYLAPEQQQDANMATPRSDQFSLGATMYHLVTGEVPRRILERRLPEMLRESLLRATEIDPSARFPSMAHMKEALALAWTKPSSNRFVDENLSSNALDTLNRQRTKVRQAHELARRLAYEQYDWGQALAILSPLPEDVREEPMYSEIKLKAEIVEGLSASVARACQNIDWFGLNVPAEILAELQPHRSEFREIAENLDPKFRVDRENLLASADLATLNRLRQLHPGIAKWPPIEQVLTAAQSKSDKATELLALAAEVQKICERPIGECSYDCLEPLSRHLREDPMPNPYAAQMYARLSEQLITLITQTYNLIRPMDRAIAIPESPVNARAYALYEVGIRSRASRELPKEYCANEQQGKIIYKDHFIVMQVVLIIIASLIGMTCVVFSISWGPREWEDGKSGMVLGVFVFIGLVGVIIKITVSYKSKIAELRARLNRRYPTTPGFEPDERELAKIRWWTWRD